MDARSAIAPAPTSGAPDAQILPGLFRVSGPFGRSLTEDPTSDDVRGVDSHDFPLSQPVMSAPSERAVICVSLTSRGSAKNQSEVSE